MVSALEARQEREWLELHTMISALMRLHGEENHLRKGDYWLVDENLGGWHHQLEIQNLRMLDPDIVRSLQGLLQACPDWDVTILVDVRGKENWPPMGLVVYDDKIEDGLKREYLPLEIRNYRYE